MADAPGVDLAPVDMASAAEMTPALPTAIRQHLGILLAEAYRRMPDSASDGEDRFRDILARLERALAVRSGRDEALFRAEFLGMVPRLRRFAMSLTKDPALADDLVQDTLLRGWRSRSRFEAGTNLGAWLFTIMRNAFYSLHRKSIREISDADGTAAEALAAAPEQPGHLDLKDVQDALAELPHVMREALILVAIENLSYEEAADVMGCRVGTVKSRVWRAREQLARTLGFDTAEIGADGMTLSILAGSRAASVV